jgi:putative hemolysin
MLRNEKGQGTSEFVLGLGFFFVLILVLISLIGRAVPAEASLPPMDMSNPHPEEKHGLVASIRIDACFENNGSMMQFRNHDTGRRADLCKLPDGKFAVRISEQDGSGGLRMVTQFIKDKMKDINEVVRYLGNRGYDPIQ